MAPLLKISQLNYISRYNSISLYKLLISFSLKNEKVYYTQHFACDHRYEVIILRKLYEEKIDPKEIPYGTYNIIAINDIRHCNLHEHMHAKGIVIKIKLKKKRGKLIKQNSLHRTICSRATVHRMQNKDGAVRYKATGIIISK